MRRSRTVVERYLPAARQGDARAFADIVAVTQNMVTSVALAVVRDVQHSEDIAQEAYLTAWKRLKYLRNSDSFLPWLRQITRNRARDHLRRLQVRPGDQSQAEDASEILEHLDGYGRSSEDEVLRGMAFTAAVASMLTVASPPAAASRQARQRFWGWIGLIGGGLGGLGGLLAGLIASGRIAF